MQQSGTAVIEPDGRISYLRRATMPFAALDLPELFRALGLKSPLAVEAGAP